METLKTKTPTKQQILGHEVIFRKSTINTVNLWKETFYDDNKWAKVNKNDALKSLIERLAESYQSPIEIHMDKDIANSYNSESHTIFLDSAKPSIITTLHEFAHHIRGESELTACSWSIWLFIKTFPQAYDRLIWDGHMLVKEKP
jgi:hypothetical protein